MEQGDVGGGGGEGEGCGYLGSKGIQGRKVMRTPLKEIHLMAGKVKGALAGATEAATRRV